MAVAIMLQDSGSHAYMHRHDAGVTSDAPYVLQADR